ncbi:MAG: HU family DNA-binding protein [Paracoccaceae bacterium]
MAKPKTKSPAPAKKTAPRSTAVAAKAPKTEEGVAVKGAGAAEPASGGPAVDATVLRKKDLLEAVVARSGLSKGIARRGLEATLDVIAEALGDGAEISAAPLAKVRVTRQKETPNGTMLVCRVKLRDRSPKDPATGDAPEKPGLAKVAE